MEAADQTVPSVQSAEVPAENIPKQRLVITRMILENFKSYANKIEIGPFQHTFNSIVGPNGSGKSNVIDALLFVFGKRAKKLRLNKVSELIHNSQDYRNFGHAAVEVHFEEVIDKPDGTTISVPGTTLVVKRIAYRDNSSVYYINDSKSSFTEVGRLLRGKGIDLDHNRFLILQGEVEQIALMKPKGRDENDEGLLEFIEDIVGTNRFKEEIEDLSHKLEEANETRTEKLNRVRVAEKEKEELEGPRAEAEEYLMKEALMNRKKGIVYQLYGAVAAQRVEELTEKHQRLQTELTDEKKKLEGTMAQLKDLEKEYKVAKKAYDEEETSVEAIKKEFAEFEEKFVKCGEDGKFLKTKVKKLASDIKRKEQEIAALEAEMEQFETEKKESETAVESKKILLGKEQGRLDTLFEAIQGETEHLRVDIEAKQNELMPFKEKINEAQQKVDLCSGEVAVIRREADQATAELEKATVEIAESEMVLKDKAGELQEVLKAVQSVTSQVFDKEAELEELQKSEKSVSAELQAARVSVEEHKAAQANSSSSSGRNPVLAGLFKLQKAGKLRGVHGRLGDLGCIDAKYDVAISTACPQLENIVVEDTATGQKCVEMLRKYQLGRATFIMLDKMAAYGKRMLQPFKAPSGAARLFDLVEFADERFKAAFYFALRDTLVADDLESATRIAYSPSKRFRVVTLGGQLIDTSGTMSGGGRNVQKGRMAAKMVTVDYVAAERGAETDQYAVAVAESEEKVQSLMQSLKQMRERIHTLTKEIRDLKKDVSGQEKRSKALQREVEGLEARCKSLTERLAPLEAKTKLSPEDQKRLQSLEKDLAKRQKELASAQSSAAQLEEAITDLQHQIEDAGGIRLKTQKFKVETLEKEIETLTHAGTKLQVQMKSHEKKKTKALSDIEDCTKEREEAEKRLEEKKQEKQQLEEEAMDVHMRFNEAEKGLKAKQDAMREAEETYEEMKRSTAQLRSVQVDLENQLDDVTVSLKENKAKSKHWTAKYADLKKRVNKQQESYGIDMDALRQAQERRAQAGGDDEVAAGGLAAMPEIQDMDAEELVQNYNGDDLEADITMLEETLARMKPNMTAIKEYLTKESEYLDWVGQLSKATEHRDDVKHTLDDKKRDRLNQFMNGFGIITSKLKEMYQMITLGGDAELELVDSLDPFSEGIVFSVRPPKKSWKNIANLSGGEKTLSSLALIFALHHYKPTPLYVMDEIDAALDFKNVSIVANYIKERTQNAQFVIISLRNNMFELADRLVGVYKTDNCTKTVTINPAAFVVPGQQSAPAPAARTVQEMEEVDEEPSQIAVSPIQAH